MKGRNALLAKDRLNLCIFISINVGKNAAFRLNVSSRKLQIQAAIGQELKLLNDIVELIET